MSLRDAFFVLFSFLAVFGAFLTVTRRRPMYAAASLLVFFGAISGVMMILAAPFLALMQMMVYAGAILVLFLFVIMLLSLSDDELGGERPWPVQLLCGAGCAVLFGLIAAAVLNADLARVAPPASPEFGSPDAVGREMFTSYVLPFEIVSVLILAATMGAVVLAKKKLEPPAAEEPAAEPAGHGEGH